MAASAGEAAGADAGAAGAGGWDSTGGTAPPLGTPESEGAAAGGGLTFAVSLS